MTALYCYMISYYNYSDSEFYPIFHEKKFTKQEFQDICNQIRNEITDNEDRKWRWCYPDEFMRIATSKFGFKDIDVLECDAISYKVTSYGEIE